MQHPQQSYSTESLADDCDCYDSSSSSHQQSNSHSTSTTATTDYSAPANGTASLESVLHQTTPSPATQGLVSPKQPSLASINVPSFSAFRKQLPSAIKPSELQAFQQQKSPRSASFSQLEVSSPRLAETASRPLSLDSPLPTPQSHSQVGEPPSTGISPKQEVDKSSFGIQHRPSHDRTDSIDSRSASTSPSSAYSSPRRSSIPVHAKYAHSRNASHAPQHSHSYSIDSIEQRFSHPGGGSRSSMIHVHRAPTMTLQHIDGVQRRLTDEDLEAASQGSESRRPKSPGGSGIGRFFGWSGSQPSEGKESSPTTTFSDRSLSPFPSPGYNKALPKLPVEMNNGKRVSPRLTPPGLDIQKANSGSAYFDNPETPLLIDNNSGAHVRELERELSHISQELAGSIKREMELEDELDRLRAEFPMMPHSEFGRRSSDYFSDSGASSTKFPITDVDARLEQLDKHVRKVEQEKANMKMETANKLQTELARRRDLEQLVQDLEDQLEKRGSVERVEELVTSLDETKRRLGQEKTTKESIEDLYSATREELEMYKNEAENLRNEVVPSLKAKVEGLEAAAADTQAIIYENTRLQQQIESLGGNPRFNSIAEEGIANAGRLSFQRNGPLPRSSSLRRGGSLSGKDREAGGRQRSGSQSLGYPDGFKEIEDQRDALHKALKLLIKRHERQQKQHETAINKLTSEKIRAETVSPRRSAYAKEVFFLKDEVSTLRKRTEDALEQKWQYEKNLSGLKMDLDRAEQETRGLRMMLQDKDDPNAYRQSSDYGDDDEEEQLTISISRAETERDHVRQVANEYRRKAKVATNGSSKELVASANRMDELAEELEGQVQTNSKLRDRLAKAVSVGEREQKESTRKIEEMQRRLAGMEDSVLAAQQHSETTLATHDAEVKRIEDASAPQLQRLRISIPEPTKLAPLSPLVKKSPKIAIKKLSESSLLEMSRTQLLERKVRELESLLREAEEDVQTVVERVNKSQMEVAELQTERDAALTQMRKLQSMIVMERERAEGFMS